MRRRQHRRSLTVRAATPLQVGLLVAGVYIPNLSLSGALPAQAAPMETACDDPSHRNPCARELFLKRCARCHSQNGTGADARDSMPEIPNFTSDQWQHKRSTAQLVASILDGKGTRMPAFAGKVSQEEVRELVKHIRAFDPAHPADPGEQSIDDFNRRFRDLQKEFERLRNQFQDVRSLP